jgi:chromate transporter
MNPSVDQGTKAAEAGVPHLSLGSLFLRFLRFGFLAWGGPVAQIAMIRHELVDQERWISSERFNRALAVYQVLPGPEATELACYFGMLSRGRIGSVLAGLGFVLPGFLMMFLLSWVYVEYGIKYAAFAAVFAGIQPAVAALVFRAVHKIGEHALPSPAMLGIAVGSAIATVLGVNFLVALLWAGVTCILIRARLNAVVAALTILSAVAVGTWLYSSNGTPPPIAAGPAIAEHAGDATIPDTFVTGLRGGLLTFGGAYTAIPFIQRDAVAVGGWLTNAQFLDGLALGGILPAPLVIFSTFVGYLAAGPWGALAMTFGMFLPAFSFTLIGHDLIERATNNKNLHAFLDGIAAGVVGLIAITALGLLKVAVTTPHAAAIFAASLGALYVFKGKLLIPLVIGAAGLAGYILGS